VQNSEVLEVFAMDVSLSILLSVIFRKFYVKLPIIASLPVRVQWNCARSNLAYWKLARQILRHCERSAAILALEW